MSENSGEIDVILVADTETAGLAPPEAGVVEIAWYEINDDYSIIDKVRSLINPETPISPIASGVHGIIEADIVDSPTLATFMADRFTDKNILMIGHNIAFDIRFTKNHFLSVDGLCTLKLARIAYPDAPDHKLQTLMFHLGLTKGSNHSALDDVNTAYELTRKIGEDLGLDLQGLYDLSKQPIMVKTMPFGKFKGKAISSLKPDYIKWLLTLDNLDDNLRYTIERI
jgi:exodeoxyribonuclease X